MKVIVGVDLNVQGHEWLLDRAARFAGAVDGRIDLVFVSPQPDPEREAMLRGLLTLLPEPVRGDARIEVGDPAEKLIELTGQYDVLVVGPREPGALQRWLLGPMAVRVMRRSTCPILVPRSQHPMVDKPKMLAGVDVEAEGATGVLEFSSHWAKALDTEVDAVYALNQTLPPIQNPQVRATAEKEFLASKEPIRQKVVALLEQVVPEEHRGEALIRAGEPENVLVHLSEDYDIVLVGNRGRTGITRLLLGNVANFVVRSSHCDVIVLPTNAGQA